MPTIEELCMSLAKLAVERDCEERQKEAVIKAVHDMIAGKIKPEWFKVNGNTLSWNAPEERN